MTSKLSLDAIEVLDAIDRKGSFASAAESLFRVPSAITYTIKQLEDDLGLKLFDRSGHRAELTQAGAELLREGRHLLQAAMELECRVKRVATGVETELGIAYTDLFQLTPILDILQAFYKQGFGTRIKLHKEVYGGSWDALVTGRASISIGAPGEGHAGGGYRIKPMGIMAFVFAVAPHHPLASFDEPLRNQDIMQYRSISAADSSRNLAPRTSGILTGQDVLSVPDMRSKLEAQLNGLGVGYLPSQMAQHHAEQGRLVIKRVEDPKPDAPIFLAWATTGGKAQAWLIKQFEQLTLQDLCLIKHH